MSERIFLAKRVNLGKGKALFKTIALRADGTFGELETDPKEVKEEEVELTYEKND